VPAARLRVGWKGARGFSTEKSATPLNMYSWRVDALQKWIKDVEGSGQAVTMQALTKAGHLDQYHYLGLTANDEVITLLQARGGDKLLDVGAGIGGPARYISWKSGCAVYAMDIQPELVEMGNEVSRMVGMADKVAFDCVDATSDAFDRVAEFDGFYSILVILHIPKAPRLRMFDKLARSCKPGAPFVIEDYVLAFDDKPLTQEEVERVSRVVGAVYIPTVPEYIAQLEAAGFEDVKSEPLTEPWVAWTASRRDMFLAKKDRHIATHGEKHYAMMEEFYTTVGEMFEGGRLGGARITGRAKLPAGAAPEAQALAARLAAGRAQLGGRAHTAEEVRQMLIDQRTV